MGTVDLQVVRLLISPQAVVVMREDFAGYHPGNTSSPEPTLLGVSAGTVGDKRHSVAL